MHPPIRHERASARRAVHRLATPLAIMVAASTSAGAEARTDDHPTRTLAPVIVTAPMQDRPLTVVTDPKAPRQPVPASDGADLLKSIPGFSVIRKGGSNGDPVLRGMSGSRLGLLIDGGQIGGGCPRGWIHPPPTSRPSCTTASP